MDPVNRENEIAVIGMSARLPGAHDIDEYWANLCAGVESISFFTRDELLAAGVSPHAIDSATYVPAYAAMPDACAFDAGFFDISPREAQVMDPQQRVFLECAWSALEHAGYDPRRFPGPVGVFAGSGSTSYLARVLRHADLVAAVGPTAVHFASSRDFLATRVSYKLGLTGPSMAVQTACSTSLVAIHVACQSLLNCECDLALAGGVTVTQEQVRGYHYQEGGIYSPDGHCRAFDARGAGTVGGSGVGVVVLRRIGDALRDGDSIHAVVKGSAINNDGASKIGFTAPSITGQVRVIAEALDVAGVDPSTIAYVEAHGTGTPLGDPVEIAALTEAFRTSTSQTGFCALGSVKTNIGHVDCAAGVAGFIKAVLVLKHGKLPPTLHFEQPNPESRLGESPFRVNTALTELRNDGTPLRAGVTSLGIGGTNAHVVLEEPPQPAPTVTVAGPQIVVLSAKTAVALEQMRSKLSQHIAHHPELQLADLAYTLQEGRAVLAWRWAAVARELTGVRDALMDAARRAGCAADRLPVAFLFPGQGTQYAGMARHLYDREAVFRQELDRCFDSLVPYLGLDLRSVLFCAAAEVEKSNSLLRQTRYTQPALFAVEYALAKLWMSWGVQPQAMLGHSIGEYVAACLAGVFDLHAALRLVAARGRLIGDLPRGAMLAVPLSEAETTSLLPPLLSLAAVNSPVHCVVSGDARSMDEFETRLATLGVSGTRLHTSHAFHSAALDPILDAFAFEVTRTRRAPPSIPFLSNVTGDWITTEQVIDARYWVRHLRETVRFGDGVGRLLQDPQRALLEVGPGATLGTFARRHPSLDRRQLVVGSLPGADRSRLDDVTMLDAVAALWAAGVEIDWASTRPHEQRRRIPLPTYPFERTEYRLPRSSPPAVTAGNGHAEPTGSHVPQPPGPRLESTQKPLAEENVPSPQDTYGLDEIVARQLAVMEAQLEMLRGSGVPASGAATERTDGPEGAEQSASNRSVPSDPRNERRSEGDTGRSDQFASA
jgi:phthiocerol/phenolphthiocerol synthesis type-I polyketide synthase E